MYIYNSSPLTNYKNSGISCLFEYSNHFVRFREVRWLAQSHTVLELELEPDLLTSCSVSSPQRFLSPKFFSVQTGPHTLCKDVHALTRNEPSANLKGATNKIISVYREVIQILPLQYSKLKESMKGQFGGQGAHSKYSICIDPVTN